MMNDVSNEYWLMFWMFMQFFYKLDQNVAQPAGFPVVKHAHPYLSPQLDVGVYIFLDLF